MSEFKFRAWDKFDRKFLSGGYDDVYLDLEGIIYKYTRDGLEPASERFIIEQYTGLRDKNGREMYEGDIFNGLHDFGPAGAVPKSGTVRFDVEQGYGWNYWYIQTIEIIGNIHENPELLER